ncbi:MAG: sulfite exporter TauE/SafE family protein, partial [Acinetobacter sp.]
RLINLIDIKTVQKVFAVVVICVAIYLVITSLMKILPMLSL